VRHGTEEAQYQESKRYGSQGQGIDPQVLEKILPRLPEEKTHDPLTGC